MSAMRQVSRSVRGGLLEASLRLRRAGLLLLTGEDALSRTISASSAELSRAIERLEKEIAEREASQVELAQLGCQLRLVLDCVDEGICGLAEDGTIRFANPAAARLLRREAEELAGCPAQDLLPGTQIEQTLRDGLQRSGRCELSGPDRVPDSLEYVVAPVRADLRVSGAIVAIRHGPESTERARRVDKVESLGIMAAGVAHDFSNLLGVILGQISIGLDELESKARVRPNLERAAAATRRAADVARQLFVYAGLGAFEYGELVLNDLILENVDLFEGAISGSIELRSELAPDLPSVSADPGQMQQVVMNLLLNAAEAIGPEGGRVTFSTGTRKVRAGEVGPSLYTTDPLAAGCYVTLSVADTGRGMDAAMLEKIFDPFFTTKLEGRGLGLATVLGVLRAHRGGVEVESAPASGTTIRLLFPERRAHAESVERPTRRNG